MTGGWGFSAEDRRPWPNARRGEAGDHRGKNPSEGTRRGPIAPLPVTASQADMQFANFGKGGFSAGRRSYLVPLAKSEEVQPSPGRIGSANETIRLSSSRVGWGAATPGPATAARNKLTGPGVETTP